MSSELRREFADRAICLEVCLYANKRLGVPAETRDMRPGTTLTAFSSGRVITIDTGLSPYFRDVSKHPLVLFVRDGIPVCLGADNPLFMNTNIGKESTLAVKAGIEREQITALTRTGIEYANVDSPTRAELLKKVEIYEEAVASENPPNATANGYVSAHAFP